MSIAEKKLELRAALNTVPGLTGYTSKPKAPKAGDAFVRWQGWDRSGDGPAGTTFTATYAVIVVLPQGSEEAADDWAYDHADVLADALQPLMYIDSIVPSLLPVEATRPGGGMYALTITGRTE